MKILTEATPLALWYEAVQAAQSDSRIILKPDLESYLVFMLMRHIQDKEFLRQIMAEQFMKGVQFPRQHRDFVLQKVADQCLLITGLYPSYAERRLLHLRYYVEMGQVSYDLISRNHNDIFSLLSQQFVVLTDVLHALNDISGQA